MAERYIMSPEEIAEEKRKKSAAPVASPATPITPQQQSRLAQFLRNPFFGKINDMREKQAGTEE